MSQKFEIQSVQIQGAVYLGIREEVDVWSSQPEEVMSWISDGWRYRFNQRRAERIKPGAEPAGLDSAARKSHSFLAAMPSMVLQSPEKIEREEWFSALKRIKSTKKGSTPKFKSFRKDGQSFVCWHNGEANANYRKLSKRRSEVVISGKNPSGKYGGAEKLNWSIKIRFRSSQEVRPYTSVRVNWTKRTVVFVNQPLPIERLETGSAVGIDLGVVHTLSDSNGGFFDIYQPNPSETARKKQLQRVIARQDIANKKRGGKSAMYASKRRQSNIAKLGRMSGVEQRRRKDWIEKTTTKLIQTHDFMAIEDLKPSAMTRKGGAHKRALNRGILRSNWGMFRHRLESKAEIANVTVVVVNPAYTSQQCSECEHVDKENRESQAIFRCIKCGHQMNADTNAAINILHRGLANIGLGHSLGRGADISPVATSVTSGTRNESSTSVSGSSLAFAGIPRL